MIWYYSTYLTFSIKFLRSNYQFILKSGVDIYIIIFRQNHTYWTIYIYILFYKLFAYIHFGEKVSFDQRHREVTRQDVLNSFKVCNNKNSINDIKLKQVAILTHHCLQMHHRKYQQKPKLKLYSFFFQYALFLTISPSEIYVNVRWTIGDVPKQYETCSELCRTNMSSCAPVPIARCHGDFLRQIGNKYNSFYPEFRWSGYLVLGHFERPWLVSVRTKKLRKRTGAVTLLLFALSFG